MAFPSSEESRAWLRNFQARVFTPIEVQDFVLQTIQMHPEDYNQLRLHLSEKSYSPQSIWSAAILMDVKNTPGHLLISYGNGEDHPIMKKTVCLADFGSCETFECIVERIHSR